MAYLVLIAALAFGAGPGPPAAARPPAGSVEGFPQFTAEERAAMARMTPQGRREALARKMAEARKRETEGWTGTRLIFPLTGLSPAARADAEAVLPALQERLNAEKSAPPARARYFRAQTSDPKLHHSGWVGQVIAAEADGAMVRITLGFRPKLYAPKPDGRADVVLLQDQVVESYQVSRGKGGKVKVARVGAPEPDPANTGGVAGGGVPTAKEAEALKAAQIRAAQQAQGQDRE